MPRVELRDRRAKSSVMWGWPCLRVECGPTLGWMACTAARIHVVSTVVVVVWELMCDVL